MKRSFQQLVIVLALTSWLEAAVPNPISLQFDSLPSAQGWTYAGDGVPETSVFSVSGGVLEQNTMGQPSSATNLYGIYGAIDPSLPFTLDFTARVLEYVVEPGWQGYGFGIGFWFDNGTERVAIGLSPNRIVKYTTLGVDPSPISTSIDTTQFHDYRLEGAPGVGWEFYADDLFIASGAFGASVRNELLFGDGTITSSARAEVTAYSFSQVPEPTTFTLLGLGSLAFLVFRQKR